MEDEELVDVDTVETNENDKDINDLIEVWKSKGAIYDRVIGEIEDDSEGYNGTKLARIKARLRDISNGLASGTVSSLIYYSDTTAFYREYEDDIYDYIDKMDEGGLEPLETVRDRHDDTEILMHTNAVINTIVWMVYEEIANEFSNDIAYLL